MIVEYKLDAGPRGMITPYWVKDGGYFQDPDNHTMIGWTPDKPAREFKVPDSVLTLSRDQVTARLLNIHSRHPMRDRENNILSDQQVTDMATAWYDSKQ